ncbi:hypothetical protein OG285_27990 [Streptomyces sp. NBC_01471]|uniref:hypothetical protein n=1 Tax=Streptomyces sp. NBC_01471 TaxID=2903879 RepID=UPI0032462457
MRSGALLGQFQIRRLSRPASGHSTPLPKDRPVRPVSTDSKLEGTTDNRLGSPGQALRPGGLLLLSTRRFGQLRREQPQSTPPQVRDGTAEDRTITFQLWDWHPDGERYDLEHFQLLPGDGTWVTRTRHATHWALTQAEAAGFAATAGFTETSRHEPVDTGFFQPVLVAKVARHDDK